MDILTHIILMIQMSFSHFVQHFNFLDLIMILIVFFYIREGYNLGFSLAFMDLASFIIAFIAALKFYTFVTGFFTTFFGLPLGLANALGFFIVAFVFEVVMSLLARRLIHYLPGLPPGTWISRTFTSLNHWLGILPGLLSSFIILSFLLTIIVTFPSSPLIKQAVNNSVIGAKLVANTSQFENALNSVFGGALNETLNFLTVEPKSDESIKLHYTVTNGTVDANAEQQMFGLVNAQRVEQGLDPLIFDNSLRDVARAHSNDMFKRGYFSHFTPEGLSPFDRMQKAGINYQYAGENLALAPSTALAMQGLMNSPGHRANILSPNFHKVGIGVIDGGIYGEMYTQDFTN
ncbi:MAG TPA: CvpA family protein [Candidatus Saccharimonadales bacterium]|nr:CvpA family protein [Candidatus Saccharimonadales bacterium]